MNNKIQILLAADDKAEAGLIRHALRRAGLAFSLRQAENEAGFLRQLQRRSVDVILSGHGSASFDGFKALELARKYCPEVPFIFLTAALSEDLAIAPFASGATNCVLKNRWSQLPLVIQRALREVDDRPARRQFEQDRDLLIKELEESLLKIKPMTGLLPVCALHAHPPSPTQMAIHG